MAPDVVKMNAHVKNVLTENVSLGGILEKSFQGWSNIYSGYFLGTLDTIGKPTNFSFSIHSWSEMTPMWSQPPKKLYGSPYGAIMYPVQDSSTPPALTSIEV